MNKNFALSSKAVSLSSTNDLYYTLVNRLSYYDSVNLNGVLLPHKNCEEAANEMAQTLVNMPVQALYRKDSLGRPDLAGHEASYNEVTGEMEFGTLSIGVITKAWISEPEEVVTVSGETKMLPCLYAEERIWKRNKNVCSAIERLYEIGKLSSSWEIAIDSYTYENEVKTLDKYAFMSNCLLGSNVTPAYKGTSDVLSVAEKVMVAEALMSDIASIDALNKETNDGEPIMKNKEKNIVTSEEVAETLDVIEEKATGAEESIEEAPQPEVSETTLEVSEVSEEATKVGEDLAASSVAYKQTEIIERTNIIHDPIDFEEHECMMEEYNRQLAEKDELILQSATRIAELEAQIAELNEYKAKWLEIEAAREAEEFAEARKKLKNKCCSSGMITEEEFDTNEELASLLDALDEKALSAIIGERLISKLSAQASTEVSETKKESKSATVPTRTVASVVDSDTTNEDKVNAFRKMFLK